jgi:DNA-binding NarL/FixJ family response regulator
MPTPKIRVLIIDDHFALRLGLGLAVKNESDMLVVGQGASVAEAVAQYREHRPDVVLMDYALPDGTGVDAIRAIRADYPEARILMLTVFDGEEDIFRASEAGACGYLTKSAESTTVTKAIRTLAGGGTFFPQQAMAKIQDREKREALSPRELEILHLIVEGLSNKEIGGRLGITEGTTKLHVAKILLKVGAPDRTRAAVLGIERGIVRLSV